MAANPNHPQVRLKRLKAKFWSHFGGKKTWRSRRKKEKTLSVLRKFAAIEIKYKNRLPLVAYRESFNKIKFKRHSLRSHRRCFACGGIADVRHHIIQLQNGGDNSKRNLLSLCNPCHAEVHPWLKNKAI